MTDDFKKIFCDIVDLLMPELTPYESSMYMLLLRRSFLDNNLNVRIGKRTLAENLGKSSRAEAKISFYQITDVLNSLEKKGCVIFGDTNREGTLYTIIPPMEIPLIKEKITNLNPLKDIDDYFNIPEKRNELFERDKWICQYCGDKVNEGNATLDHFIPQSKGGSHSKDNLRTCCLLCNSIKSGKSYEEAAPLLLKSIQERKQRLSK